MRSNLQKLKESHETFQKLKQTYRQTKQCIDYILLCFRNIHRKYQLYIFNGSRENQNFPIALRTVGRPDMVNYRVASQQLKTKRHVS